MARISVVRKAMTAATLAAVCATACPTPVPAQQPRAVAEGDRIRITALEASSAPFRRPAVGVFGGATADTIYLRGRDALIAFHRPSVRAVEVSAGRATSWKTGATVGALLGAAAGVAAVVAYCAGEDCQTGPQSALVFGAAFGVVAGGLGALVGLAIPGRDRWVPAEVRLMVPPRR